MTTINKQRSWTVLRMTRDTNDVYGPQVKASASLRYSTRVGGASHIKGEVTLERFGDTALFRIFYVGKAINDDGEMAEDVTGTVYLPIDGLPAGIQREHLKSKHTKAHAIKMVFAPNKDGITWLQLIIPANTYNMTLHGQMFGDALEYAEKERHQA